MDAPVSYYVEMLHDDNDGAAVVDDDNDVDDSNICDDDHDGETYNYYGSYMNLPNAANNLDCTCMRSQKTPKYP